MEKTRTVNLVVAFFAIHFDLGELALASHPYKWRDANTNSEVSAWRREFGETDAGCPVQSLDSRILTLSLVPSPSICLYGAEWY